MLHTPEALGPAPGAPTAQASGGAPLGAAPLGVALKDVLVFAARGRRAPCSSPARPHWPVSTGTFLILSTRQGLTREDGVWAPASTTFPDSVNGRLCGDPRSTKRTLRTNKGKGNQKPTVTATASPWPRLRLQAWIPPCHDWPARGRMGLTSRPAGPTPGSLQLSVAYKGPEPRWSFGAGGAPPTGAPWPQGTDGNTKARPEMVPRETRLPSVGLLASIQ